MRKNKLFVLGIFTVMVALVSLSLVSNTWARYTSTVSDSDSARVAKWGWEYAGDSATSAAIDLTHASPAITIDLFKTTVYELDNQGKVTATADGEVKQGTAITAPHTGGQFKFNFKNVSEVTASYTITFAGATQNWPTSGEAAGYVPFEFSIDNQNWVPNVASLTKTANIAMNASADITVYWRWNQVDANNSKDTALGVAAATQANAPEYVVTATVEFTQVD